MTVILLELETGLTFIMIISNSLRGISFHLQFLFFHSTGVAQSSTDSFSSLLCFCQNAGSRQVKNRVSQRLLYDQPQFETT